MDLKLRPGKPKDAETLGGILYEAFSDISSAHNYVPDFPSPEAGTELMQMLLSHPKFYSVVAELDGRIVGSNFVDERSPIAGLGPISVDPKVQNRAIGRALMDDILKRAADRGFAGYRGVQAAYHNRTMALYTKMGFVAREPLSCLQGTALGREMPGCTVRPASSEDLDACNRICVRVHGHHRSGELEDGMTLGTATVVERRTHHGLRERSRLFRPCSGRNQRRCPGAHRSSQQVRRAGNPRAYPKYGPSEVVSRRRFADHTADDAHHHRPVQRTCRCLPAGGPLLRRPLDG